MEEQRNLLVKSWIDQTYSLQQCNIDKEVLRNWREEQQKIYVGK